MDKLPFKIGDVPIQRNFDAVKKAIDALLAATVTAIFGAAGVSIRFGATTVSTTAAVFAANTVTHGLGKTPIAIFATVVSSNGVVNATVGVSGSMTFDAVVRYTDDVARTTSNTVYWLVIG
jgi:hypothetical protein